MGSIHASQAVALPMVILLVTACDAAAVDDAGPGTSPDAGAPASDAGPGSDAGAGDAGGPRCAAGGLAPGDSEVDLLFGGERRSYLLHIPSRYDATTPTPLVLNFHGFSTPARVHAERTRMNEAADANGFIAVHAKGTGILPSWNGGDCCGSAAMDDVDDVSFVRALVQDITQRACVDPSRIYSTGFSNGGFLSHRLACEASDLFAAIAPVSGVMGVPATCAPERPVPVIHFHGTDDAIIPYDGGDDRYEGVQSTIDGWVARNECTGAPVETFAMGNSSCETYEACAGGAEVTLCTVDGGAHVWPGSARSNADIDATAEIWEFFSRHHL